MDTWLPQERVEMDVYPRLIEISITLTFCALHRHKHVPDSSNHSLHLIKLLNSSSPEVHCEGNQPPDAPKPKNERFARPSTIVSSFFANISYKYVRVIVNRQRHHNIRNGIVWAQTGHSTGTCTATLCVIEL